MLKTLVKKQLMEIFRSYFYNAKTNKKRSTAGIIAYILLFAALMIGLGGMFTGLSVSLCAPLTQAGMGWLYFALMSLLAIFLGAFGSVFNTYAGLYLAKDNDLLLSMPIPVRYIMLVRLLGVYLMGLLYSGIVLLPAAVVYLIFAPVTALTVVGVVVGICAVIVMISMGIAESHNNDEMLKNMGGLTKIEVYNYGSQNINGQEVKLDNEAVQRFRKIDHVTAVTPYYQPNLNLYVEAGKNNRYRASNVWSVLGLDPDTMPLLDNKLESGDWPKSGVNYGKDVIPVVVGKEFLYQFEDTRRSQNSSKRQRWSGETDANGNQLPPFVDATKDTFTLTLTNGDTESPKTQSYKLKIVGVVSEESEDYMLQYGITFRLNDLLMLSEAYSKLAKTDFNPKKVTYNEVYIKVDNIKNVDKICDTLKEEGYQISSMVDYRKQMQQQTAQRQLRLAGLAAISLFVAALNIANTMTMAIYERTREIGVMKVLGCEIGNIRRMFLIESGMIGFIGGVAGTILSYIISFGMNNMTMIVYGLNTLLMKLGINATIDLSSLMGSSDSMYYGGGMYMSDSGSGTVMSIIPIWLVLAAIGFAVVVGLLSGIVPASRAVRISALEAIRHD